MDTRAEKNIAEDALKAFKDSLGYMMPWILGLGAFDLFANMVSDSGASLLGFLLNICSWLAANFCFTILYVQKDPVYKTTPMNRDSFLHWAKQTIMVMVIMIAAPLLFMLVCFGVLHFFSGWLYWGLLSICFALALIGGMDYAIRTQFVGVCAVSGLTPEIKTSMRLSKGSDWVMLWGTTVFAIKFWLRYLLWPTVAYVLYFIFFSAGGPSHILQTLAQWRSFLASPLDMTPDLMSMAEEEGKSPPFFLSLISSIFSTFFFIIPALSYNIFFAVACRTFYQQNPDAFSREVTS